MPPEKIETQVLSSCVHILNDLRRPKVNTKLYSHRCASRTISDAISPGRTPIAHQITVPWSKHAQAEKPKTKSRRQLSVQRQQQSKG